MDNFNMKALMGLRGIGNKELSDMSGVPLGTLNKIIYGNTKKPTLDNMWAIAKALRCRLDDFVEEPSNPSSSSVLYLSEDEQNLIRSFRELNQEGRDKVIAYTGDLTGNPQYIKNSPNELVDSDPQEVKDEI